MTRRERRRIAALCVATVGIDLVAGVFFGRPVCLLGAIASGLLWATAIRCVLTRWERRRLAAELALFRSWLHDAVPFAERA